MTKFQIDCSINIRAHGCITVEAESLEQAKAMITEDENFDMAKHFEPFGGGDDDFCWNHQRPEIFARVVTYETDDGETDIDLGEDWPTKEERTDEERDSEALKALKAFADEFGDLIDSDEEMPGSDTVDAVCRLWPQIKGAIAKLEGRS